MTPALTRLIAPVPTVLVSVTDLGEADTDWVVTGVGTPEFSWSTVARTALLILPSSTVRDQVTPPAAPHTTPVQTLELISAAPPLCQVSALRLVRSVKAVKFSIADLVSGQTQAGSQTTELARGTQGRGRGGESPREDVDESEA